MHQNIRAEIGIACCRMPCFFRPFFLTYPGADFVNHATCRCCFCRSGGEQVPRSQALASTYIVDVAMSRRWLRRLMISIPSNMLVQTTTFSHIVRMCCYNRIRISPPFADASKYTCRNRSSLFLHVVLFRPCFLTYPGVDFVNHATCRC